jgi:hypothetical protein
MVERLGITRSQKLEDTHFLFEEYSEVEKQEPEAVLDDAQQTQKNA